nr:hypothetical protein [Candidatus Sigynarchaeum springense]
MTTLVQQVSGKQILVNVAEAGDVDPEHTALLVTSGDNSIATVAFQQVLPGVTPGGAGIRLAGRVLLRVGYNYVHPTTNVMYARGSWSVDTFYVLNPRTWDAATGTWTATPSVDAIALKVAIDEGMVAPIVRFVDRLNRASAVVRRIEARTAGAQDTKKERYLSLQVTFDIGGVPDARMVMVKLAQDPGTKAWHVGSLWWAVVPADPKATPNYHRIDWPGIYTGVLPGWRLPDTDPPTAFDVAPRDHEETLVGFYGIDPDVNSPTGYSVVPVDPANPGQHAEFAHMQFTSMAFDAVTGLHVVPMPGEPGLYGWLEARGPVIDGVRTPIPYDDPRHPYTLAARLRAGTISLADYEAGMLRVFGWILQFAAECPAQPCRPAAIPDYPTTGNPDWSGVTYDPHAP